MGPDKYIEWWWKTSRNVAGRRVVSVCQGRDWARSAAVLWFVSWTIICTPARSSE